MKDMKTKLSLLWIFAMFNYLYADVLSLFDSDILKDVIEGRAGSIQMTDSVLFGAAVLMETAIMMVLLSQILSYRLNRWANIAMGLLHTLAVFGSTVEETPAAYYAFFATIEIACTLYIIWLAWQWKNPEVSVAL
ncbi:MAG: hypothetical protein BroJett018_33890 [Chloroflexota bacterium]|nr:MAG: hypothetical protein BroJett018_33890 [Chloroflexota bacterium]